MFIYLDTETTGKGPGDRLCQIAFKPENGQAVCGLYNPGKPISIDAMVVHHITDKMVQERLGTACKNVEVDQGLGGAEPGSRATYFAMCHLSFDSIEAFQNAFGPNAEAIMGDVPNYTDTQPVVQISEVKI